MKTKLSFLGLVALIISLGLIMTEPTAAQEKKLRIGYQKSSTLLILLKGQGRLEKILGPKGVTVEWKEYSSGLPMVEALNRGVLDLSADVADTVPLFAQSAGVEFTYFMLEKPSPMALGIVVPKDSPIKTTSELGGKRLAVAKASGAHYLVMVALKKARLVFNKDVSISFLQPEEASAAFESGSIDAWATWDPFLATVEVKSGARIIDDGARAGVVYMRFYLISNSYLEANPDVAKVVADELIKIGKWVKDNPDQTAEIQSPLVGLDIEIVKLGNSRRSYDVAPVDEAALFKEQKIADIFVEEKILTKSIKVINVPVWNTK